ncbi:uncharacterized protein J3R85_002786 [Psidium guajava]|nr:uncharacterized protein J3R85_002786 [Psidium guajava]
MFARPYAEPLLRLIRGLKYCSGEVTLKPRKKCKFKIIRSLFLRYLLE